MSSLTKWVGGHGAGLGGIIVDKGGFPWGAGKHPIYDEPDTSYSGMRWGHDLPAELAPLSFILRARTVPLRNLGACMSRESVNTADPSFKNVACQLLIYHVSSPACAYS